MPARRDPLRVPTPLGGTGRADEAGESHRISDSDRPAPADAEAGKAQSPNDTRLVSAPASDRAAAVDGASAQDSSARPVTAPRQDISNKTSAAPGRGDRLPEVLRQRREFLACARARRWSTPGMVVQGRPRGPAEGQDTPPRIGFTASKKVGNAVARNRAKRRLREAARAVLPAVGRPGWDYVLIARAGSTAARPFALLTGDLEQALGRLHQPRRSGR